MKKIICFIPLGIAISSIIIYIFNIISFKMISDSYTMFEIISNLKIYLFIAVLFFVIYFVVNYLFNHKESNIKAKDETINSDVIYKTKIKEVIIKGNKRCYYCGKLIFDTDNYCSNCGKYQENKKSKINPLFKNIIYVVEIIILILILYFLVNMLFDYKEKQDPNFKSPLKVNITK